MHRRRLRHRHETYTHLDTDTDTDAQTNTCIQTPTHTIHTIHTHIYTQIKPNHTHKHRQRHRHINKYSSIHTKHVPVYIYKQIYKQIHANKQTHEQKDIKTNPRRSKQAPARGVGAHFCCSRLWHVAVLLQAFSHTIQAGTLAHSLYACIEYVCTDINTFAYMHVHIY